MMKRPVQSTVAAAAALMALVALTACGEKPQTGAAIPRSYFNATAK